MNGQNYDSIYNYEAVIQRMISNGHQVASHTWDHADLATLDEDAVIAEMTELETALLSIIGKFPTYMRPPYTSYTSETLEILGDLGYHVIVYDIDTLDYDYADYGDTTSLGIFESGLDAGGTISLEHDVGSHTAPPPLYTHTQRMRESC